MMFQVSNMKPAAQVGLAGQSRTHADFQPPTLADLKSFPAARRHHQTVMCCNKIIRDLEYWKTSEIDIG